MEKYTIQKGDSLWKIAGKKNISLEALIAANPQIKDINSIMPGLKINIPRNPIPKAFKMNERYFAVAAEEEPEAPEHPSYDTECNICNNLSQEKPFIYTCVKHDSIDKIVERFSVPKSMLLYCNPQLKEMNQLYAGDKLFIPGLDPALTKQEASFCSAENDGNMKNEEDTEEIICNCCTCPYCGKDLMLTKCIK